MSKSYDVSTFTPPDPTSVAWAIASARRFMRDTPNEALAYSPRSFDDSEIVAQLALDSVSSGGVVYYRPHVSAAHLVRSDPERVLSFGASSYSESYRDADAIARGILRAGAGVDALINTIAGSDLAGRFARVAF
jgi:hypothetical protein